MLFPIGRAVTKQLALATAGSLSRRIVLTRLAASTPVQQLVILKPGCNSVRGFATRDSQTTSAATGRAKKTTTATKKPTKKSTATEAKQSKAKSSKAKSSKATSSKAKSSKAKSSKAKSSKAKSSKAKKPKKPKGPISKSAAQKLAAAKKRELRSKALFTEPARLPENAWLAHVYEQTKGKNAAVDFNQISQKFKELSASELQRLEHVAQENKVANAAAYKAWVESHTPAEMEQAIKARATLKRVHNIPRGKSTSKAIHDDRIPKRPASAYMLFVKARWASGDYAGLKFQDGVKTQAQEWKNLPAAQRHPYEELSKAEWERYVKAASSVLGRSVSVTK
ncbi:hypothetical protein F5B20DRAFT_486872 [Whalleya microplaca]|nr:hypothetical protein F5B20DRAFT_486872 [Whalleya microplaca]